MSTAISSFTTYVTTRAVCAIFAACNSLIIYSRVPKFSAFSDIGRDNNARSFLSVSFCFHGVSHVFAQFVDVVIVGEFFIISSRFLFCVRVSACECVRVKYD